MSEKDLLKHLDGKADGKKVAKAKAEKEAVVSEEAEEAVMEDTPEPDGAGKSFFFKRIPGMGTMLFKVTAKVRLPPIGTLAPTLAPTLAAARLSLGMVRCVVCVPSQMEGQPDPEGVGKAYGPNVYTCQRYDIDGDDTTTRMQVLATCQHASHRVP